MTREEEEQSNPLLFATAPSSEQMPPPVKLKLFYDITSPWSYVAYEAITRYRQAWNLQLDMRPMFLGGVLQASKNVAPAAVPNKRKWMASDIEKLSAIYKLDMRLPEGFPFKTSTMQAMRFLRVLQDARPDLVEEATKRLWVEFFVRNTPSASPEFLGSLSPSLLTSDELSKLVAESQTPANKERLKVEAEKLADEGGAFGFPWIVVERSDGAKENFFGSDRMESISWWLGKEYPYTGPTPPILGGEVISRL